MNQPSKEMIASGAAEEAWGYILRWAASGKIRGTLTYDEVREVYEPLILDAINRSENAGDAQKR